MAKIHEYLGVPASWPVRENLRYEIALFPSKTDLKNAQQGEPRACALRNAACRMFDIPNCAIGGRYAYIPQRDEDGNWFIARVEARVETQRALRKFDKTKEMPEGGFRFGPVNPSQTLKAQRIRRMKNKEAGNISLEHKKTKAVKRRMAPLRAMPRGLLNI